MEEEIPILDVLLRKISVLLLIETEIGSGSQNIMPVYPYGKHDTSIQCQITMCQI